MSGAIMTVQLKAHPKYNELVSSEIHSIRIATGDDTEAGKTFPEYILLPWVSAHILSLQMETVRISQPSSVSNISKFTVTDTAPDGAINHSNLSKSPYLTGKSVFGDRITRPFEQVYMNEHFVGDSQ
jgi:hypothetical protein